MSTNPPDPEHDEEDEDLLKQESIRRSHEDRDRGRRKLTKKPERLTALEFEPRHDISLLKANVIGAEGPNFLCELEDGTELRARTYKGTTTENLNATLVAVGDVVQVAPVANEDFYAIERVEKRRTRLSRSAAGRAAVFEQVIVSNVDLLVIVASIVEPPLRSGIIDRYIVAALDGGLEPVIAINKTDLANEHELEELAYFKDVYEEIGYRVFPVSSASGEGIEALRTALVHKLSVFAGHSGVGKSSIINALFGRVVSKTGALSKKYQRGAHTTTSSTRRPLEGSPDSFVIDTPGVREFSNYELDPMNLKYSFVEFTPFFPQCAMPNCSHIHEPGCAVLKAVEDDKISIERYSSYSKLFEEAEAQERKRLDRK